jgi:thiol:disulfide interchange protein DsbC
VNKFLRYPAVAVIALVFTGPSPAAEPDLDKLRGELARSIPEAASGTLRASPVAGLYELDLNGELVYVSADGKFLVLGDIVDIKARTNLTRAQRERSIARALDAIGEQNMIVIGPAKARRIVTVFTDVDCPYCVRLHQEVPELNRNGVKVRYLLYPRSGLGGETFKRSVAVWCAADRAKAIGIAKAGGKLDMKSCDNPVQKHFELGMKLHIEGTPAVFLDDGRQVGGYLPAAKLLGALGIKPEG